MDRRIIATTTQPLGDAGRHWKLALLLAALLLVFSVNRPAPASMEARVTRELAQDRFDFVTWEIEAVWQKLTHKLIAPQRYMTEVDRRAFVLDYLDLVDETHRVEREIHRIFVDPEIEDAEAATVELRARRQELRREIDTRQPIAEAILEEQVAWVLHDEGFGVLGQEIPPVEIHFTPLPRLLVISPRHRIENFYQLSLAHGLDAAQQEAIEQNIDASFNVSSLITGIGGLSTYPSMLLENSSINWITEVSAHEWTHHYLLPRPLGRKYLSSTETRRINETVATIVGQEVGRKVVARYYPEHLPPEPGPILEPRLEPEKPGEKEPTEEALPDPSVFDFRMEMRETRIRVDNLLTAGKIEEAEAYMEMRRQMFVEQGYAIRKLNQAYFAFHGSYAAEPGAAGDDPIGPAVRELFSRSPDLHTFVRQVAGVTTLTELERVLDEQRDIGSHSGSAWKPALI